jgi:hypothetical protein
LKKFRILFYIPAKDGHYVDNAIGTWTRLWNLDAPKKLICSHEEIWLPDDYGSFRKYYKDCNGEAITFYGDCWTSTMGQLGGKDRTGSGVRKAPASEILKHPERWFYCEFEVPDASYKAMLWEMEDELLHNQGYDTAMVLNFFLPLGIGAKDKFICSEFTNYMATIALRGRESHKQYEAIVETLKDTLSPLRSAWTLARQGITMYNLDGSIRYSLE